MTQTAAAAIVRRGLRMTAVALVALAGVYVLAIGYTSAVLAPLRTSFRSADKHPEVTERVLGDRELLHRTYPELKDKIAEKDAALAEARKLGTDSDEYKQARTDREAWEKNKRVALVYIGAELLWERYKRARRAVIVGVFLIVAGVVAFAWGGNPPEDEKKAPPVVLGQAPVVLDVTLTRAGVRALREKRKCRAASMTVLSIGGADAKREVVSIPTPRCRTVRFVLAPNLGTATAAG